MTGENTDCHSGKVKTAPIYQMEAYQKTPPKVKNTHITQKSPNWSQQLENIKSLQKQPQQNLKKIVKHSSKPCSIEKWVFQSTRLKHTKTPCPKWNIPASLKSPQIGSNKWKKTKVCKKNPTKSKKNSKTFEQTLQYWKMGLPIYQIEAYQKTPPKVKHTSIPQKSPNWLQQLENIKSLQKKTQQNLKKIVKHLSKPCSTEKWVFQSTRLNRTKRQRPKWNIPASLKNPQFGPRNRKTSKVCKRIPTKYKKNIKTFEQTRQYLKMGLPFCQIKAYQKVSPKLKHASITQKFPNWSW